MAILCRLRNYVPDELKSRKYMGQQSQFLPYESLLSALAVVEFYSSSPGRINQESWLMRLHSLN